MAIDALTPRSRRALLAGLMGTAAAIAAQVVGRPIGVSAANGGTVLLGRDNDATSPTVILMPRNGVSAFSATNDDGIGVQGAGSIGTQGFSRTGIGVLGSGGGTIGVEGRTNRVRGIGVHGHSDAETGKGIGVRASTASSSGIGLLAEATATNGPSAGAWGQSDSPNGTGVIGWVTATAGATQGVHGRSFSPDGVGVLGVASMGGGVLGYSGPGPQPAARSRTGVTGVADQDAGSVGVRGIASGRGGVFQGPVASLRLMPSAAATHPAQGAVGDLFLDATDRLWFCKGGSTWKQLA